MRRRLPLYNGKGEIENHVEKEGEILCIDFDCQLPNLVRMIDLDDSIE